ncbi:hypothetical protein GGS24DRAFT_499208 [Hypoxylon argillaceum]|nr:hypothetical protein GGS24DRAFT_499208 [Hypoxylon argillaceum]
MKPNDVIALIIGLHILLLGLLSYGLVRLFRVWPPLSSTTYSSGYLNSESGSADARHSPPPPPRPGPPLFPGPIPGGWVGLRSPQLGLGRTNRSSRPGIAESINFKLSLIFQR